MRDVPDAFITAIKEGTVKVTELYEFTLRNGVTYYYTSHSDDIDWGTPSLRYYSAPLQRTEISTAMNLEVDTTSLTIAGISRELFEAAKNNQLEGIALVEKRILWDQSSDSGMEFIMFVGTGRASYTRNTLTISVTSVLNSLNIVVPRNLFQQPCNWGLFSTGCTLVRADYKESSTATLDAASDYTIIDSAFNVPGGDPKKYNNGEIEITSGDYIGERRGIILSEDGLFVVAVPFPGIILSGVTFDYYPGCDYVPETCRDRFSNKVNFYGFIYLPAPEESG